MKQFIKKDSDRLSKTYDEAARYHNWLNWMVSHNKAEIDKQTNDPYHKPDLVSADEYIGQKG